MSGASAAAEAIKDTARDAYRATFEAGAAFAIAHSAVVKAADVVEVMARTIDLLVAAESLHDKAEQAVKTMRAKLAEQMQETGAVKIEGAHHTAHLARKPAFLSISDEAAIPRDYFVQPPPALDKRAVKSALTDGIAVPGVSLAVPNEMSLVFRARKQETAQ